jgi:hypothetical protein
MGSLGGGQGSIIREGPDSNKSLVAVFLQDRLTGTYQQGLAQKLDGEGPS